MSIANRLHKLDIALSAVSKVLDGLLAAGSMTTNFMKAGDDCMYVPEYLFRYVREASSVPRFEDRSRDHRNFVDRLIFDLRHWEREYDISVLEMARSELALPDRDSLEHAGETRALHMAKMLEIGWGLLAEAAEKRIWQLDPAVSEEHSVAMAANVVPFRYKSRKQMLLELAERHHAAGSPETATLISRAAENRYFMHGGSLFQ